MEYLRIWINTAIYHKAIYSVSSIVTIVGNNNNTKHSNEMIYKLLEKNRLIIPCNTSWILNKEKIHAQDYIYGIKHISLSKKETINIKKNY